jgi:aspartate/tyrosine/aromatic aminotransferase
MGSWFESVQIAPDDPILSIPPLFAKDQHPQKVNLGIGSYRTADGKPYLLQSVARAQNLLSAEPTPKDYLPIDGDAQFLEQVSNLILGDQFDKECVYAAQTVGATNALCIAAHFLGKQLSPNIAISTPSWSNHDLIFSSAGFKVQTYPYYDVKRHVRDVESMLQFLQKLEPSSIVLFQTRCHNPTGSDLNLKEWTAVLEVVKERKLFTFFDNAYQGFAESIEKDVFPIRLFQQHKMEMAIASSFSKNFGLYGERIGALHLVLNAPDAKKRVASQIKQIIRSIYSTPPIHGGRLIATILKDPDLKKFWNDEVDNMRTRVKEMRQILASGLISKSGSPHYQFLESEQGFFSLLGISEEKVKILRSEKGIYLPTNGRINIAGLTPYNVEYVIDAIAAIQ